MDGVRQRSHPIHFSLYGRFFFALTNSVELVDLGHYVTRRVRLSDRTDSSQRDKSGNNPGHLCLNRDRVPRGVACRWSVVCTSASGTWRAGLNCVPGRMMTAWACTSDGYERRSNTVIAPRFAPGHSVCLSTCRKTIRRRGTCSVDCGMSACERPPLRTPLMGLERCW